MRGRKRPRDEFARVMVRRSGRGCSAENLAGAPVGRASMHGGTPPPADMMRYSTPASVRLHMTVAR